MVVLPLPFEIILTHSIHFSIPLYSRISFPKSFMVLNVGNFHSVLSSFQFHLDCVWRFLQWFCVKRFSNTDAKLQNFEIFTCATSMMDCTVAKFEITSDFEHSNFESLTKRWTIKAINRNLKSWIFKFWSFWLRIPNVQFLRTSAFYPSGKSIYQKCFSSHNFNFSSSYYIWAIYHGKMGHIPIQSWYSSGHIFYDRVTFWNRFWDFWNPQRVESIINTFFQWITDWNRS